MLHTLYPVLAATVAPVLLLAPVVYALRPQGGRHSAGLLIKRAASWTPYDARVRRAIAHYADKQRDPGLGAVR